MGVIRNDALLPWDSGTAMLANVKRRITRGLLLVLAVRHLPLGFGELSTGQQTAQDLADVPCRVALCFSGNILFFGQPLVHQSVRQNVIESIEADSCRVDVFAYAALKDATPAAIEQAGKALQAIGPTRVVWHKDQAGIIPNSCSEKTYQYGGWNVENQGGGGGSSPESQRKYREESTRNLYWKLYHSLASFRMVQEAERMGGFRYDWIVSTRFNLAWIRPLPPLRLFSPGAVWFGGSHWPVSDHFALVPRDFGDKFFGVITGFYDCDGSSWSPPTSWWQPACQGESFDESILFRHLHAANVPYRLYSMFEYVLADENLGGKCSFGTDAYHTTCGLLAAAHLLRPSFRRTHDCAAVFAEWVDLRCLTLLRAGASAESARLGALVSQSPRAWEELVESSAVVSSREGGIPTVEDLEGTRSKLAALRDAVLFGPPALNSTDFEALEAMESGQTPWGGSADAIPLWWAHSQSGCSIAEYRGRAPHVIRYYKMKGFLFEEAALAIKCLAHSLSKGSDNGDADDVGFETALCSIARPLNLVMIDVSFQSEELGICTADGSSGLSPQQHIDLFFSNPAAHCVGYGRLSLEPPKNDEEVEREHVTAPAPPAASMGDDVDETTSPAEQESTRLSDPDNALSFPPACPNLEVQNMSVIHPREGAVYWEGPVQVKLEVTLKGPKVGEIDLRYVQACADIEESWPILDWSRSCVSLEEMASPEPPFLVFGSVMGVILGSVSLWDARPACTPKAEARGRILPIAGGVKDEVALKRFRFKIVHHGDIFHRRGRPLGPAPFGRGIMTTENLIADLEQEADADLGPATDEMQRFLNRTYGDRISLRGDRCVPIHDMHGRGTSIVATGFLLEFIVDQLDWMIANAKLPEGMRVVVDRFRKLQANLLSKNGARHHEPIILTEFWRDIAPFFQKTLVLPAPSQDLVASTAPLHTWEYDEIPWMEALNPAVDWNAVEEAYLGNEPVPIAYLDGFFSPRALEMVLDMARSSTIFFDCRQNYIGAYPSDGMSHPLLYQIAEEISERLPRIMGRGTSGWPLAQMWFYIYGGNDGKRCTHGIKVHADSAVVNLNIWLAPDSANLGSVETDDAGGLTVFHARPPDDWGFSEFNRETANVEKFLRENDVGNTSVPHRQNRALLFDSGLFHQSEPFRFKEGFENRRINLTLLFGVKQPARSPGAVNNTSSIDGRGVIAANAGATEHSPLSWHPRLEAMREQSPTDAARLRYCL